MGFVAVHRGREKLLRTLRIHGLLLVVLRLELVSLGVLGVVNFRHLLRSEAELLGLGLGVLEFGAGFGERLLLLGQLGEGGLEHAVGLGGGVQLAADFPLILGVHAGALVVLGDNERAHAIGLGLPLALGGGVHLHGLGVDGGRAKVQRGGEEIRAAALPQLGQFLRGHAVAA